MTYFAVIDTNVLVSALLKEYSVPWKILDFVNNKVIVPLYNDEIINEYIDVLSRNKFGFTQDQINAVISIIEDVGINTKTINVNEIFVDKNDKKFFEIVMSSKQERESYLITGNIKHFPKYKFIITPNEMLNIIENDIKININSN